MVLISSKESHCHSIMQAMNCLRKEGRLCDVSLAVGDTMVTAHRCVLVAGSDYFKSRFIGPFKADNLPLVDLSSITNNVSAVEFMLNFLYTGEISINNDNLESILKVSSFFVISELRDLCIDFMEKNLDLSTCLKYFLLSVDHMIPEVEKKIAQTVKSRYHDYLIFEEKSLEISPEQLLYLVQNCQIFENCSNEDILVYLTKWVDTGNSEAHELLGCDILELVCSREKRFQMDDELNRKSSEAFNKLKDAITCEVSKSAYKIKLKKVITKYFSKSRSEIKSHLRSLSSRSPCSKTKKLQSDTEEILITISPKHRLIENTEKEIAYEHDFSIQEGSIQEGESVFDVCAYVPRTRSWYYMQEGLFQDVFEQICVEEVDSTYCLMLDKLCCLCPFEETVNMLNLKNFTWQTIDYTQVVPDISDLESSSNDYCVCTEDQNLYLLLRVKVFADEDFLDVTQVYFKCYRLTPENTWTFLFNTPKIETSEQFGSFAASVSSASNEMLLVYGAETCHVFVAEMSFNYTAGVNGDVPVYRLTEECGLTDGNGIQIESHILETKDHFYIMSVKFPHTESAWITCSYKYKLRSRQLTCVENPKLVLDDSTMHYRESLRYPCVYSYSFSDKKSLWIFGGNKENGSSLKELTVDNKGKLTVLSHKPPPFACITAATAGKVNAACLTSLQTISKFLR